MLWQCHEDTKLVFLDTLWPEFDLWQFLPVLVEWQWEQKKGREERGDRSSARQRVKTI
jgi:ditrans,polycis-polyprenyl diphosphate synthase